MARSRKPESTFDIAVIIILSNFQVPGSMAESLHGVKFHDDEVKCATACVDVGFVGEKIHAFRQDLMSSADANNSTCLCFGVRIRLMRAGQLRRLSTPPA